MGTLHKSISPIELSMASIQESSFLLAGSFVGSTAFWVYILIGEFVLLLIYFDVILYFKQRGAIYSIMRKCRTKPFNVNEDEVEANIESQTLQGISFRYIFICNFVCTWTKNAGVSRLLLTHALSLARLILALTARRSITFKIPIMKFLNNFFWNANETLTLIAGFSFLLVNFNAMSDTAFSSFQDVSRTDFPSVASKARRL